MKTTLLGRIWRALFPKAPSFGVILTRLYVVLSHSYAMRKGFLECDGKFDDWCVEHSEAYREGLITRNEYARALRALETMAANPTAIDKIVALLAGRK